jgi:hypothetical protein
MKISSASPESCQYLCAVGQGIWNILLNCSPLEERSSFLPATPSSPTSRPRRRPPPGRPCMRLIFAGTNPSINLKKPADNGLALLLTLKGRVSGWGADKNRLTPPSLFPPTPTFPLTQVTHTAGRKGDLSPQISFNILL